MESQVSIWYHYVTNRAVLYQNSFNTMGGREVMRERGRESERRKKKREKKGENKK